MSANKRILVVNGPNLNLLGKREPEIYGSQTLTDVVTELEQIAQNQNVDLTHIQSNHEGELIDAIHQAMGTIGYIVINPAAFTHTSVALRDALAGVNIPFFEVHISNVHARESFRHKSYLSDKAEGVICGFGVDGYKYALLQAISKLENE